MVKLIVRNLGIVQQRVALTRNG